MLDKNRQGIVPLFILLLVGVVVLAGGAYVVRNQFVKPPDSQTEKASLNIPAIQKQVANPTGLPELTPGPDTIAPAIFHYTPAPQTDTTMDTSKTNSHDAPSFTITPPSGWLQSNPPPFAVVFLSPEKDEEEVEEPLNFSQPASVQVEMHYSDKLTSYPFEAIVSDYQGTRYPGATYITNSQTTFSGQTAQKLELVFRSPEVGVDIHIYELVFVKNSHLVIVRGLSLDSAWGKRSGALTSSVNSFSFN